MEDSSTSSTSQSHLEKTQPFHFRATFETQDIQLVANIRKLHQHTINSRSRISRVNKAIILKVRYITIPIYFPDFELGFTVLLRSSSFYCSFCSTSHFIVFNVLGFTVILTSMLHCSSSFS
ncbi:hypothetical protein AHAS_Ahas01G0119000 [Arachis hypogaea]